MHGEKTSEENGGVGISDFPKDHPRQNSNANLVLLRGTYSTWYVLYVVRNLRGTHSPCYVALYVVLCMERTLRGTLRGALRGT